MTLQGKGFMIWKVPSCEKGDANVIAAEAKKAGLTHVLIKVANGIYPYNIEKETKKDLVPPVVFALKEQGIQVWGWHYVFGDYPIREAEIAVTRVKQLGLDGYTIDAEAEYKRPGMEDAARRFMAKLREGIPNTKVSLCSYRYPNLHREFPWKAFLEKSDYNMPQVYWEQAHNAGEQLKRCVKQFMELAPFRPIMPMGPVYKTGGWLPYAADITDFLVTARHLNLSAANFFAWDWRSILSSLWDAAARFPWPTAPVVPKDMPQMVIDTLNTHDHLLVSSLYADDAVHITADKTAQGPEAIGKWYKGIFSEKLPKAKFTLTGDSGSGNSRKFTWTADSPEGKVTDGSDVIGILDGRITYHYSYFTIR
jgi:hypothetical protein